MRFVVTFSLLITLVGALSFASLPAALAAADDDPPTCQKTTERVLQPFLDSVEKAQQGRDHHATKTAEAAESIREFMAKLTASRANFDAKRQADLDNHDNRIGAAKLAISDIAASVNKRLAELHTQLRKAIKAKDENSIKSLRKSIADLSAKHAAREVTGYAPKLGYSSSTKGWQDFVTKETAARAKTTADHAAGNVPIYLGFMGYSISWSGAQERLAAEREKLADTLARKNAYYLPTLGYSLDGAGIDKELQKRLDALREARMQIAAGTFKLYVPTLGYSTDRNHVQGLVDEATAALNEVKQGWGNGLYINYNNKVGYRLSKDDIDDKISELQRDLAHYQAIGDEAAAYVPEMGYTTTGTAIREAMAKAEKAEDKAKHSKNYGHWRRAREGVIDDKTAKINKWQEVLDRHREIWQADIDKREEDLAGRLATALAQTPCGGSSQGSALMDRHGGALGRLSESDRERNCRQGAYGDLVYISPSGQTYGTIRDALLASLADTGVGDGRPFGKPPAQAQSYAEQILDLKNDIDWLAGWKDGAEFGINRVALTQAQLALTRLQRQMTELSSLPGLGKGQKFKKARNKLVREFTKTLNEVIEANGYFSSSSFSTAIEAFEKGPLKGGLRRSKEARAALSKLTEMKAAATSLNSLHLPKLANMMADFGRVTSANMKAAGDIMEMTRKAEFGDAIKGMGPLDRFLLAATVAAAVAEMSDLQSQGKAVTDAAARAGVNMTVELVIGGIPLTAAAHAASLIVFESASRVTGDDTYRQINVEQAAKDMAQAALDQVAAAGASAGASSRQWWDGEETEEELLANVDRNQAEQALVKAEADLALTTPGSTEAHRLLRIRRALRRLLRAQEGLDCSSF